MGGANGSRECAPDDKLRDTHHGPNDGDGFRESVAAAKLVIRGLDPRIHRFSKKMDCRIKSGNDG